MIGITKHSILALIEAIIKYIDDRPLPIYCAVKNEFEKYIGTHEGRI